MNTLLPWHDSLWQQVLHRKQQNRLPHALLLSGPKGMGKGLFAQCLAEMLLCEQPQPEGQPCGQCKACYLLRAKTHPDVWVLLPADTGKQITVDQIRALIQFSTLTPYYGRYQVIIINPAEAMNRNAANSLLKLLEEPPANTLIMLVSHQPMALVATLRSRCQQLDFSRPDRQLTQAWLHDQLKQLPQLNIPLLLNLSVQAPLAALSLAKTEGMAKRQALFESLMILAKAQADPVSIAERWSQWEVIHVLQWLFSWTTDIIRYASTGQAQHLMNPDYQDALQRLARQLDLHRLFYFLDLLCSTYELVLRNVNVKPQGLLESIAIAWVELGRPLKK